MLGSMSSVALNVDVVLLPQHLSPGQTDGKTVVVFDVLRATTTITAALHHGLREVRVFGDLHQARSAADAFDGPKVLCGEHACVRPAGFDLGNSPSQFDTGAYTGRTALISTTNGTKALIACRGAARILAGALVNAPAVARYITKMTRDAGNAKHEIVLLCAGTNAALAMEDLIGCGAVLRSLTDLHPRVTPTTDTARLALHLFDSVVNRLPQTLRNTTGGRNILSAGLEPDIDYAARLGVFDTVGIFDAESATLRAERT